MNWIKKIVEEQKEMVNAFAIGNKNHRKALYFYTSPSLSHNTTTVDKNRKYYHSILFTSFIGLSAGVRVYCIVYCYYFVLP